MRNLAKDIIAVIGGRPEAVVICGASFSPAFGDTHPGRIQDCDDETRDIPDDMAGKVLAWDEAEDLLDYEYDEGFGGVDCHAFYAWRGNLVAFLSVYDGATSVNCLPRNPIDAYPGAFGGG